MADKPPIRLWTWQSPDWDITCQPRQKTKIVETWGADEAARLMPVYEEIERTLGPDIIFCTTQYEHWGQIEVRRLWKLDVPVIAVRGYIDQRMWNILRERTFASVPEAKARAELFIEPDKALRMISSGCANADVVPLLSAPIDEDWVIGEPRFNLGPTRSMAKYEDLPKDELTALRARNASSRLG